MAMEQIFSIAGSALSAQLVRLNTTASNLANASTASTSEEDAFRAQRPVFRTLIEDELFGDQMQYSGSVVVDDVVADTAPPTKTYDPDNPLSNDEGYVFLSNVNEVEEMVELNAAATAYRNNVEVINTAKQLMMRTLEVLKT